MSEDSIVAGPMLQPDQQITEMDQRVRVSDGGKLCLLTFGCSWTVKLLGMSNVLHYSVLSRKN